jgi:epoxyqueuosine reductase QueG
LREMALAEGAVSFGLADLGQVETSDFLLEPEVLARFKTAISIAVPVSRTVLATIREHPNQVYFHHYRQLNALLDRIALKVAQALERAGHCALPVAASQIVDWQNQRAHVSHKRIAAAAGLGWIGRNNLLVTPEHGSQVRLVTVLTDVPFETTHYSLLTTHSSACASCRACIAVCPAKAIKESAKDFDHQACFAQLKEFQRQGFVGQYVCGICVRACGRREHGPSGSDVPGPAPDAGCRPG